MSDQSPQKMREQKEAETDMLMREPAQYVALMDSRLRANPNDAMSYFERHRGWFRLGRKDLALDDIERAMAIEDRPLFHIYKGHILADQGRYADALTSFSKAEALAPDAYVGAMGPLFQADCHARLGDEQAAVTAMDRMEDQYYPGIYGTPSGTKAEIMTELRRRAAAARHGGR